MNKIKNFLHGISEKMKNKGKKLSDYSWKRYLVSFLILVLLIGVLVVILRVEEDYTVLSSYEKSDTSSTQYLAFGKRMFKYSADGVSCMDGNGQTLWNCTFSMQSPIADVCEGSVVVADQQGTDVYIFDEKGQKGQFETLLPIEKVKVEGIRLSDGYCSFARRNEDHGVVPLAGSKWDSDPRGLL